MVDDVVLYLVVLLLVDALHRYLVVLLRYFVVDLWWYCCQGLRYCSGKVGGKSVVRDVKGKYVFDHR